MFQKLINATGTLQLYIIGALIIVIALLGLSLTALKADVALKNTRLETAAVSQRLLQDDLTAVTDSLKAQADEHDRLAAEYALALELIAKANAAKADLAQKLDDQREQINNLRTSANAQTRSWANTAIPDDVKCLLDERACAHSGH